MATWLQRAPLLPQVNGASHDKNDISTPSSLPREDAVTGPKNQQAALKHTVVICNDDESRRYFRCWKYRHGLGLGLHGKVRS